MFSDHLQRPEAILEPRDRAGEKKLYRSDCEIAGREPDDDFLDDLHFHDLRHEATSRLFESGRLEMMEVASITRHKDLRMLKRYTQGGRTGAEAWVALSGALGSRPP